MHISGFTDSSNLGDATGRMPGAGGFDKPKCKTKELLKWMDAQIAWATACRDMIWRRHGQSAKDAQTEKKRKGGRRRRSNSSSSYCSDTSSSSAGIGGRDHHKLRKIAREQPGVNFATVVSDLRSELGGKGLDFELGLRETVFRKWYQYCFG